MPASPPPVVALAGYNPRFRVGDTVRWRPDPSEPKLEMVGCVIGFVLFGEGREQVLVYQPAMEVYAVRPSKLKVVR